MISSMIALDPSARPSVSDCLKKHHGNIFPETFYSVMRPLFEKTLKADYENIPRNYSLSDRRLFMLDMTKNQIMGIPNSIDAVALTRDLIVDDLKTFPWLIIINLALASTRSLECLEAKLTWLRLINHICGFISVEDRLDRVLPYIMFMIQAQSTIVRISAIDCLLSLVNWF